MFSPKTTRIKQPDFNIRIAFTQDTNTDPTWQEITRITDQPALSIQTFEIDKHDNTHESGEPPTHHDHCETKHAIFVNRLQGRLKRNADNAAAQTLTEDELRHLLADER